MQPDIEITRQATSLPIEQIAEKLNIPRQHLYRYGADKAKVDLDYIASLDDRPDGKLILVTAITPTPAGEGTVGPDIDIAPGREVPGPPMRQVLFPALAQTQDRVR